MKVLLVAERDELYASVERFFKAYGAEILRYWSPLKAMDNLDEVEPDAVIFSAEDFPRHWKVFLSFMRFTCSKEKLPFILLASENFDHEDNDKALHLDVNGIFKENISDPESHARMEAIFQGYGKLTCDKAAASYEPSAEDRIDLLFIHPETLILVRGSVKKISHQELTFLPLQPEKTEDLSPPLSIPACSIRIGRTIHTVDLELIENTSELLFRFIETPKEIMELVG